MPPLFSGVFHSGRILWLHNCCRTAWHFLFVIFFSPFSSLFSYADEAAAFIAVIIFNSFRFLLLLHGWLALATFDAAIGLFQLLFAIIVFVADIDRFVFLFFVVSILYYYYYWWRHFSFFMPYFDDASAIFIFDAADIITTDDIIFDYWWCLQRRYMAKRERCHFRCRCHCLFFIIIKSCHMPCRHATRHTRAMAFIIIIFFSFTPSHHYYFRYMPPLMRFSLFYYYWRYDIFGFQIAFSRWCRLTHWIYAFILFYAAAAADYDIFAEEIREHTYWWSRYYYFRRWVMASLPPLFIDDADASLLLPDRYWWHFRYFL